ncbi:MAG: ABC transporter permease [Polyangiales bacterium]
MIGSALGIALRTIRRNPMRSFLTMLGVVIGVASVVSMVTLGRAATARVTADIASFGQNLLVVSPGADRHGPGGPSAAPPFEMADVRAIARDIPGLVAVAPSAGTSERVIYGNKNWRTTLVGSTNDYLVARSFELGSGRSFTEGELRSGTPVCLVGDTVRRELFGTGDPLDATVRLGRVACRIVGTLASKGQAALGSDQDDIVIVPLTAYQRRIAGSDDVTVIFVSVSTDSSLTETQRHIRELMRKRRIRRASEDDDFAVRDLSEVTQMVESVTGVLTALLAAIAAVSLVVGGIGIMNIMLVSVTERTREIGLRLAVGALARDVLLQFLVESVTISSLGGLLGVAVGLGGSALATKKLDLPFVFDPAVVVVAFVFAAFVGIFFGLYPAFRASRLDPIEALRHE